MDLNEYDAIRDRFLRFLALQNEWEQIPVKVRPLDTAQAIGRRIRWGSEGSFTTWPRK